MKPRYQKNLSLDPRTITALEDASIKTGNSQAFIMSTLVNEHLGEVVKKIGEYTCTCDSFLRYTCSGCRNRLKIEKEREAAE
jgi:hypothetical protein